MNSQQTWKVVIMTPRFCPILTILWEILRTEYLIGYAGAGLRIEAAASGR